MIFDLDAPVGGYSFQLDIDPDDEITEFDENKVTIATISIEETEPLKIAYAGLVHPPCVSDPLSEDCGNISNLKISSQVVKSYAAILAMFPLGDTEGNIGLEAELLSPLPGFLNIGEKEYGKENCSGIHSVGMISDLSYLTKLAHRKSYDRIVGIVPDDYFVYHKIEEEVNPSGLHHPDFKNVGLVKISTLVAIAPHEIGHTFDFENEYETSPSCKVREDRRGKLVDGYWVAAQKVVNETKALGFMGSVPEPDEAILGENFWISQTHWDELFEKTVVSMQKDAGIETAEKINTEMTASVGIIIYKSGEIEVEGIELFNETILDNNEPGNYKIELHDYEGNIVYSKTFSEPNYKINIHGIGLVETEAAPVLFLDSYFRHPRQYFCD